MGGKLRSDTIFDEERRLIKREMKCLFAYYMVPPMFPFEFHRVDREWLVGRLRSFLSNLISPHTSTNINQCKVLLPSPLTPE